MVVEAVADVLRAKLKYADLSEGEDALLDEVRSEMFREMEDLKLTLH